MPAQPPRAYMYVGEGRQIFTVRLVRAWVNLKSSTIKPPGGCPSLPFTSRIGGAYSMS